MNDRATGGRRVSILLAGMFLAFAAAAPSARAVESTKTRVPIESVFACSHDGQFAVGHEESRFVGDLDLADPYGMSLSGLRHFELGEGTTRFPMNGFPADATLVNVFLPGKSARRVLLTIKAKRVESAVFWNVDKNVAVLLQQDSRLTCASQDGNIAYAFDNDDERRHRPIRFKYDRGGYDAVRLPAWAWEYSLVSLEACSADGSVAYGWAFEDGASIYEVKERIVRFEDGKYRSFPYDYWDSSISQFYPMKAFEYGNLLVCSDDGSVGYASLKFGIPEGGRDGAVLLKLKPDMSVGELESPHDKLIYRLGCTPSGSHAFGRVEIQQGGAIVWNGRRFQEPSDKQSTSPLEVVTASDASGTEFYGNAGDDPFLYVPTTDSYSKLSEVLGFPEVHHLYAASRSGQRFYCRLRDANGGQGVYLIERGDEPPTDKPDKPGKPKVKKQARNYGNLANYYAEQGYNYSATAVGGADGYDGNGYYAYVYSLYAYLYTFYSGSTIAYGGDTGLTRGQALANYLQYRSVQVQMSASAQTYSLQQYANTGATDPLYAYIFSYYAYYYGDLDAKTP